MTTFQAIIFDLDDTLYPEVSFLKSGFRAVAEHVEEHWSVAANDCFQQLMTLYGAGVRGNTFNQWLTQQGLSADHVPRLVDVYRSHHPRIELFPGIQALLTDLHADHRIGLISDGLLEVQQRKFAALQLQRFFSAVVFSDCWGRECWKPNTRPYVEALRQLAVAPDATVYVGDNPAKDFIAARKLGMWTVQFRHADGVYRDVPPPTADHHPHRVVSCVDDLRAALSSPK